MQSMKGATSLLSGMNRQMNLPALQRIAMEFERENDIMDQRQEMMDDAIDDVTGLEDEEEGEEVVNQVLDEIGVDLNQAVSILSGYRNQQKAATDRVRWARRHLDCKRTRSQKTELLRQLVVVGEEKTTIFKREWTIFDGNTASIRKDFVIAASAFGVLVIGSLAIFPRAHVHCLRCHTIVMCTSSLLLPDV